MARQPPSDAERGPWTPSPPSIRLFAKLVRRKPAGAAQPRADQGSFFALALSPPGADVT